MSGSIKTDSALITEMPVNGAGQIVPQFIWDTVVSKQSVNPAFILAAGNSQGSATLVTVQFNIITGQSAGGLGVVLGPSTVQSPTALFFCRIWNLTNPAVTINVYPPSGVAFNNGTTNVPIQLGYGAEINCLIQNATTGYAV